MTLLFALALHVLEPSPGELAHQANDLYTDGRFAEASAAYAEAYQALPNPDYLYGWAQSERLAGNCTRAVELYREYADLDVSERSREAADMNAKRCGGDIETPAEPPAPVTAPTPVPDRPRRTERRDEAWRSDIVGLSLVTAGGALGIAAVVLAVDSRQQWRLAEDAEIEAQYARKLERSTHTRTAAIVCASVGAAALAAGVIRLVIVERRSDANAQAWIPGRGVRF